MRKKSENEARDRYARRYAAVLAVEALIQDRGKNVETVIVVEAEDNPLWDDIRQIDAKTEQERRHQVKRQQTPITEDEFSKYVVSAAKEKPETEYRFAFPVLSQVTDAGEMHVLRGLCDRVQQKGAVKDKAFANLRDAERTWIDCITKWTRLKDQGVYDLLQRLHIDIIGYEGDLDTRAQRLLEPIFGHSTEEAWVRIRDFVSDKDVVVEIRPGMVWEMLPKPSADEIDTFYWSLVEEAEERFILDGWDWLTDNLVRDIMPIEFHDGALDFVHSIEGAAWPGRYPEVEGALKSLSHYAHEYIRFFDRRSETSEKWVREDKSYKRIFPNPNYWEEAQAANKWRQGVQVRFGNMVVALNELFAAIRLKLRPTYRLREGRLGIHDNMGVTNEMVPVVWYPKAFGDPDAKK
jgi:hypothetical protein